MTVHGLMIGFERMPQPLSARGILALLNSQQGPPHGALLMSADLCCSNSR